MSGELGRLIVMRKKVRTGFNNLGTPFTFYYRVIEAYDHFATKGLRFVKRWSEQLTRSEWDRTPLVERGFIPNPGMVRRPFGRLNNTGWWRRNTDLSPLLMTERMLMRHGWYRRKLRKQGIWMKTTGPNEVMLTAAGISPEKMGVR